MYWLALLSLDTMPFALLLMIAYKRADYGKRVVLEEHVSRFPELSFPHHAYHRRDRGVDRTSCYA